MRVLMLAQFYPPIPGGAELHVRNLAQGLAQRDHAVAVATLRQEGLAAREDDGPVQVHRLGGLHTTFDRLYSPGLPRAATPIPDPVVSRGLYRLVRDFEPDVVHAHNWISHSYLPVGWLTPAPLVVSLHNYGLICAKQTLIYRGAQCSGPGVQKCLRCAADHYGTLRGVATVTGLWTSRQAEVRAVRRYLPVSRAVAELNRLAEQELAHSVVPNFVPDDVAADPVADDVAGYAAQLPDGPFLLYVGALATVKGLPVLFDAYRRLADPPPLVVIGFKGGDMGEALAGAPDGAHIHLDWPHYAVMEAWRRCAIGVVPSAWAEPCPTVVIEAMAAGVAIVGSDIGGIPELLGDGEAGVLVPPGNAAALADALRRLLADEPRRAALREAARARSARYLASAIIPQIEAAYRDVVGTPGT